jgi:hypothetical protein
MENQYSYHFGSANSWCLDQRWTRCVRPRAKTKCYQRFGSSTPGSRLVLLNGIPGLEHANSCSWSSCGLIWRQPSSHKLSFRLALTPKTVTTSLESRVNSVVPGGGNGWPACWGEATTTTTLDWVSEGKKVQKYIHMERS